MQDEYVAFGNRLRQIRKEQGLSLEEFAQKLGTTKQVLSRYETNQRSPKIATIAAYAKRLDVTLDYMLNDSTGIFSEEARGVAIAYDKSDDEIKKNVRNALHLEKVKRAK